MKPIIPLYFQDGIIYLLDQTLLPFKEKWLQIDTPEEMIKAIQNLSIRGAPLLGLAGLYGLFCSARHAKNYQEYLSYAEAIRNARPTAINLSLLIDKEVQKYSIRSDFVLLSEKILLDIKKLEDSLFSESLSIAKHGNRLLKDGDCVLTHCNTGSLATLGWGTALGIIKYSYSLGKNITVLFTETRPLLQGARLTAYELSKANIPSTLIVDSAVGFFMKQNKINLVITGADRIASNGDTANKIGTYPIAVLAKHHQIPFYIAAPISSFDLSMKSGDRIPIEYREENEIWNNKLSKKSIPRVDCINPAFDVTPTQYIAGFVTEQGILTPPFK